jgi:hypothetical protein
MTVACIREKLYSVEEEGRKWKWRGTAQYGNGKWKTVV